MLETISSHLARFPDGRFTVERRTGSLLISPTDPEGFSITVFDEGEEVLVAAERWHTHFDDAEQAAFCTMWLLTPFYRVVQEYKGALIASAWLERWSDDGWQPLDPAYFLNPEVETEWRHQGDWTRVYRSQNALAIPWDYRTFAPQAELDKEGLPPNWKMGIMTQTGASSIGLTLY